MGNTPSSEAPRKAPQKLSKHRVGNHATNPDVLSPSGASASSSTRYSSSYLAASLPLSPRNPTGPSVRNAIPDGFLEGQQTSARRLSRRESDLTSAQSVPESPRTELRDGRCYSLYATSSVGDRLSRANSVVYSDAGSQTLSRTQSWHGRRIEKSRSVHSEMHAYGSQRLPRRASECVQELRAAALESHLEMQQLRRTPSLSSHSNQRAGASLTRTTSDLSLYAPVRRRSIIRTPGVATRLQRDELPFMQDKSRFRRSQPLPLTDQPSFKSVNTAATKHLSMLPQPIKIEPQERAVTPCEADYQQLGGIKFGSLRITNGSPASSAAPERGQRPPSRSDTDSPTLSTKENELEEHHGDMRIVQPKPHINVISPVVSTFAEASTPDHDVHDVNNGSPDSSSRLEFLDGLMPSPFPNNPDFPRFNFQLGPASVADAAQLGTNDGNIADYLHLDIPNIKQDSDNEAPLDNDQLDLSARYVGGVSRSDSGFGSNSSSDTSQKTTSKADSGYSSNPSLRSVQSSSQDRPTSDQSMHLETNYQSHQYTKPRRRILEKPPPPISFSSDGSHKHGKLYNLLTGSERKVMVMDHGRRGVSNPMPTVVSEAETLRHRSRSTSASRRYSHKVDPSSATLNTILSVESLPPPADLTISHDVGETEPEKLSAPSHPLKKRRSLRAVADFAQAATSKLRHRKSLTGRLSRSDKNESSERREASMPASRSRQTSATMDSTRRGPDHGSNNPAAPGTHDRSSRSRSNTRTLTKSPPEPSQTSPSSQGESHPLRTRASAPNLRESLPNQPPPSPTTPERSSQIKQKAVSPKPHRSRGVMDPGIPPPIPPQFRPFKFHASPPPLLSQKSNPGSNMPLCSLRHSPGQSQESLAQASALQEQCEYVGMGQSRWQRPIMRRSAQESDHNRSLDGGDEQNPPGRVLHSYSSPAYKGVPIWG